MRVSLSMAGLATLVLAGCGTIGVGAEAFVPATRGYAQSYNDTAAGAQFSEPAVGVATVGQAGVHYASDGSDGEQPIVAIVSVLGTHRVEGGEARDSRNRPVAAYEVATDDLGLDVLVGRRRVVVGAAVLRRRVESVWGGQTVEVAPSGAREAAVVVRPQIGLAFFTPLTWVQAGLVVSVGYDVALGGGGVLPSTYDASRPGALGDDPVGAGQSGPVVFARAMVGIPFGS